MGRSAFYTGGGEQSLTDIIVTSDKRDALLRQIPSSFDDDDIRNLQWSLGFMYEIHGGAKRLSGHTYAHHPLRTAYLALRELRPQSYELSSLLLLHDTVEMVPDERQPMVAERIRANIGETLLRHVQGMTVSPPGERERSVVQGDIAGRLQEYNGRGRKRLDIGSRAVEAVASNVIYIDSVHDLVRKDPLTPVAKAYDVRDNAFHLNDLITSAPPGQRQAYKGFAQRVANKYAPLIPILYERLSQLDADQLGLSEAGLARLRNRFSTKSEQVKELYDLARGWEYHDEQRLYMQQRERSTAVQSDPLDTALKS